MLAFEQFKEALTELVRYIRFDDAVSKLFSDYSKETKFDMDFPYQMPLVSAIVSVLEAATGDSENGWISYWLFELNCGDDYHDGVVTKNEENIPLRTIGDLWNLLCSEQEAVS